MEGKGNPLALHTHPLEISSGEITEWITFKVMVRLAENAPILLKQFLQLVL